MSKVTEAVEKLAAPVVASQGCELWDVEYVREAGTYFLRVYIDKEGGVSIDDCEAVSRALDPVLDEADPVPDSYVFEVGSPGLERALKRPGDFERFMGEMVTVKLYSARAGKREFVGKLSAYEDGRLSIEDKSGEVFSFDKKEYSSVRLYVQI